MSWEELVAAAAGQGAIDMVRRDACSFINPDEMCRKSAAFRFVKLQRVLHSMV